MSAWFAVKSKESRSESCHSHNKDLNAFTPSTQLIWIKRSRLNYGVTFCKKGSADLFYKFAYLGSVLGLLIGHKLLIMLTSCHPGCVGKACVFTMPTTLAATSFSVGQAADVQCLPHAGSEAGRKGLIWTNEDWRRVLIWDLAAGRLFDLLNKTFKIIQMLTVPPEVSMPRRTARLSDATSPHPHTP